MLCIHTGNTMILFLVISNLFIFGFVGCFGVFPVLAYLQDGIEGHKERRNFQLLMLGGLLLFLSVPSLVQGTLLPAFLEHPPTWRLWSVKAESFRDNECKEDQRTTCSTPYDWYEQRILHRPHIWLYYDTIDRFSLFIVVHWRKASNAGFKSTT